MKNEISKHAGGGPPRSRLQVWCRPGRDKQEKMNPCITGICGLGAIARIHHTLHGFTQISPGLWVTDEAQLRNQ